MNNKKHDLRLYVGIFSTDPVVAFLNIEGLVRFCTNDYEEVTSENKMNDNMHLTNYGVNKLSDNFKVTEEVHEINDGSKRTLESYWKQFEQMGLPKE